MMLYKVLGKILLLWLMLSDILKTTHVLKKHFWWKENVSTVGSKREKKDQKKVGWVSWYLRWCLKLKKNDERWMSHISITKKNIFLIFTWLINVANLLFHVIEKPCLPVLTKISAKHHLAQLMWTVVISLEHIWQQFGYQWTTI